MRKKLITTTGLAIMLAATLAAPAPAAAASPGACNMLHVSSKGMDGMLNASDRGLGNMMALVLASEAAGCSL